MKRYVSSLRYLLLALALMPFSLAAQEWMNVYRYFLYNRWEIPFALDSIDHFGLSNNRKELQGVMQDGFVVPFDIAQIDSIAFAASVPDNLQVKDHYRIFEMFIYTIDGQEVTSKEDYVPCVIALNGGGSYANRFVSGGIRGRGNSTWLWYDKKPYRIRLDKKQKILGMAKARSWVLLANYRDVTDLMNTFAFELGHWMGLPYTNHTRYVELFLNNRFLGLYQLTEQVQQNDNRVAVSDERGILISLDVDDGPTNSPHATDNFWSKGFGMPVTVKYPDDEQLTLARRDSIRDVFAVLEDAIKRQNYAAASELLDMESFVRYLLIQELLYNVELSAPRSVFMYKDGDGKWGIGPLWDLDAGYDFDWSDMYTGHTFFSNYRETVMGTNPVRRNGNYPYVPQFFTNLFGCKQFVKLYKNTWNTYADSLFTHTWGETEKYLKHMREGAIQREIGEWPVGKRFDTEVNKMKTWLQKRIEYMDQLVNAIPEPK